MKKLLLAAVVCAALPLSASMQHRVDGDAFLPLRGPLAANGRVTVAGIPVGDGPRRTLVVEQFDVLASADAIAVTYPDGTTKRLAPPALRQFRGHVEGEADSLVHLSIGETVEGLLVTGDRRFTVRSRRDGVFVDEIAADHAGASGGNSCSVDGQAAVPGTVATNEFPWPSATATSFLDLIVDVDAALYANLGSNETAAATYALNLIGAASTIFRRDLRTDLRIKLLKIWAGSDPFTVDPGVSSGTWNGVANTRHTNEHALAEYADYHQSRVGITRAASILLSGQEQRIGLAWTGMSGVLDAYYWEPHPVFTGHRWGGFVFCNGIGRDGAAVPNPDANPGYAAPATNYWSLLQVAHELGHSVQSPHTHCIPVDAAKWGRSTVDACAGDCGASPLALPAEKGTIMSYCQNFGSTNIRFLFGKVGEASEVVLQNMRARIDGLTPDVPLQIAAPASVAKNDLAVASVAAPVSGQPYQWTIVNGTFTDGGTTAGASTVTFLAKAHPVTLRLFTWNQTGYGLTDARTVPVVDTCAAPNVLVPPTGAAIVEGGVATLSVTSSGTTPLSYQWYSGPVNPIAVPGATSATIQVSPAVTTSYFVRISNGCQSTFVDSAPAQVSVCPKIRITRQPASFAVTRGRPADIQAEAGPATVPGWVLYEGPAGDTSKFLSSRGLPNAFFTVTPLRTTSYWLMAISDCPVSVWASNTANSIPAIITVLPPRWQKSGDHDGDGRADILWHNPVPRQNAIWFMNGTQRTNVVIPNTDPGWEPHAVGDWNGDGKDDIFWHRQDGQTAYWLLNRGTVYGRAYLPAMPRPAWVMEGSGDFNGDGRDDLFWRNRTTGETRVWLMNAGRTPALTVVASRVSDLAWEAAATGDFNGDGRDDLFWRQPATGQTAIWFMNGGTAEPRPAPPLDAQWWVEGSGDFDGDGRDDIYWSTSTGPSTVWFLNGTNPTPVSLTSFPGWRVAAAGDYDGDGRAELLLRHPSGSNGLRRISRTASPTSRESVQSLDSVYQPATAQ